MFETQSRTFVHEELMHSADNVRHFFSFTHSFSFISSNNAINVIDFAVQISVCVYNWKSDLFHSFPSNLWIGIFAIDVVATKTMMTGASLHRMRHHVFLRRFLSFCISSIEKKKKKEKRKTFFYWPLQVNRSLAIQNALFDFYRMIRLIYISLRLLQMQPFT